MSLPLAGAHGIEGELGGLKGALQALGGAHGAPDGDLAWVELGRLTVSESRRSRASINLESDKLR